MPKGVTKSKSALRIFLANSVIRFFSRWALFFSKIFNSVLSYAKTYALFPQGFESDLYIDWRAEVGYPDRITVGRGVRVGPDAVLGAFGGIDIGDNVRLSRGVRVETGGLDFTAPLPYPHKSKPIKIGNEVWVGTNALILGGVTVGRGAVIGAGSVVTKDIPDYTVVAGNPARVIRMGASRISAT